MSDPIGFVALLAGLAYLSFGLITGYELVTRYRTHGLSRFGLAFFFMALTCGPHHLEHAAHVLLHGEPVTWALRGGLLLALGPALVWVVLRAEALLGGRGERFLVGTPVAFAAVPWVGAVGAGAVLSLAAPELATLPDRSYGWPSVFLGVAYGVVGALMVRTQVMLRRHRGGWSLSGTSLGAVFATCGLSHLLVAPHVGAHLFAVDLAGVPAATFFLWQTHLLYREAVRDWNRLPLVGHPARTGRRSPWAPAASL